MCQKQNFQDVKTNPTSWNLFNFTLDFAEDRQKNDAFGINYLLIIKFVSTPRKKSDFIVEYGQSKFNSLISLKYY